MLSGLLRHNTRVTVHFLHGPELGDEALSALAGMVAGLGGDFNPQLVDEDSVRGLPPLNYISEWYRILLPELLPEVQRVLYLDCDTLVVDGVDSLWELDLRGHYLAAINDVPGPGAEDWVRELGIPAGTRYFNSGVLLMNLETMRADRMTERLAEFGRANAGRLRRSDQDTLNVVLGDRRLPLHPRWNCQNTLFSARPEALKAFSACEIDEATASPAILHFEGPGDCKPWHFLSGHPWTATYREVLAGTPWASTPLWGRTLRNRLIAATLPAARRVPVYARIEQYKHRLGLPSDIW